MKLNEKTANLLKQYAKQQSIARIASSIGVSKTTVWTHIHRKGHISMKIANKICKLIGIGLTSSLEE